MDSIKERRVVGPPGTGKTSYLAGTPDREGQIARAAQKYGPHRVMVCSFTRAAVRELVSRDLPVDSSLVGTLHSICFHALDAPEICETAKHFKAFSEDNPQWSLSEGTRDGLDDGYASPGDQGRGDEYLREYARLRAVMRPRNLWPPSLLDFAKAWEGYKAEIWALDFEDLIEQATLNFDHPPGLPDVAFLDEHQDFTRSEQNLVARWGEKMDRVVYVADPDQCLYSFKGARPDHFLTPIPPEYVVVLKQSYRVPQAVHAFAEKLINKIPAADRVAREYLPRGHPGEVRRAGASFKNPEGLLSLAQDYLKRDKKVLFLASCSYQLSPLLDLLRREGLPFHNPWRRKRRDWNPLHKNRDQVSAGERVEAFLSAFTEWDLPLWTPQALRKWTALTKGVLHRGGKEKLLNMAGEAPVPVCDLLEVMPLTLVVQAQRGGLEWLESVLSKQWERSARYAIRVARRDPELLRGEPRLLVGTGHSLKGGEADVVVVCPDLSPQGMKEFASGTAGRNSIIRLFYVMATRARESLILAAPGSRLAVPWW